MKIPPPILPTPIFQIPPCNLQPPPPLLFLLCFFKTIPPILPTPPFLWEEKSELLLFLKISKTQQPFHKGWEGLQLYFS